MSSTMSIQDEWRCCDRCMGLFFGGNAEQGACPAGGKHDGHSSSSFIMHYDPGGLEYTDAEGAAGIQIGWRRCLKCEGLFAAGWAEPVAAGKCPAGGEHDGDLDHAYVMQTGPVPQGMGQGWQPGWQSCPRCQGLFFAQGSHQGVCPAGGTHSGDGTVSYDMLITVSSGGLA